MADGRSVGALIPRILAALVLVHVTYNPEGWSFYHWAIEPLVDSAKAPTPGPAALKFLAGVVLVAGWVVFVQATRRSLGMLGAILVMALAGGAIWLLLSLNLATASSGRSLQRIALIVLSLVLGVGMSWSHIQRKASGQIDTDEV
jgi:hypothetical protein